MKTQIKFLAYLILALGFTLSSCDEDNDPQPENKELLKVIGSVAE